MSYGTDGVDMFRHIGACTGNILGGGGAKPADLPVQQSTKFEFGISRKTAEGASLPSNADMGSGGGVTQSESKNVECEKTA
jgi:hypothetical protein